ncbi:MAG: CDP-alcohol phosphatidyltransferase [Fibrobacteres bacterium]|nr:CDP-alcohol phosphatidyltransferase [Fibrobacterota bacterium]
MVKSRFLVPNLFTGLNFLLGIYSILVMHETFTSATPGQPILGFTKAPLILAAWMILWCVLFDKLDGFAARILKASSDFGAQFDSLADMAAFGIAPGFLVFFYLQNLDYAWFAGHRPLMIISLSVYMLCASMRLARYNAIDSEELKNYFHGLPSTFAGGFMAITVILYSKYEVAYRFQGALLILPLMLIFTGILMVSPLYLPKLVSRKNKAFNLLQIANIIVGYICGFGMVFPEYLYVMLLLYGVFGFAFGFLKKGMIEGATTAPNSD